MPTEKELEEMKKKAGLNPLKKAEEPKKKSESDIKNWHWAKRFYFASEKIRKSLKASTTGHHYKYCTLQDLMNKSYPILAESGFVLIQKSEIIEGKNTIKNEVFDMFNDCVKVLSSSVLLPEKDDKEVKGQNFNQVFGSTITYTRRYSLYIILGILPEEDKDGVYKK